MLKGEAWNLASPIVCKRRELVQFRGPVLQVAAMLPKPDSKWPTGTDPQRVKFASFIADGRNPCRQDHNRSLSAIPCNPRIGKLLRSFAKVDWVRDL